MKINWAVLILFILVAIPLNMYLDGSYFAFGFKAAVTFSLGSLMGVFK